ncbi:MAG: DNA polymerase [Patescibacteria group bacterium]
MKTTPQTKTLVLLDVHAIIHRAYHALPDFSSAKGEPTGALYGLSSMLIGIIKNLAPDYIVACYDLPEPTYRHEVYEGYKAGRPKIDDALVRQLEHSKDVFTAFGIPMYSLAGFEADDMLGTIVDKLKERKDISIIIASGDMDTMQLISGEQVKVYTLKKGINDTILYDEDAVMKRFGFTPPLLTDYKGLRGDPSDNIIGIKGIGEKTATTLITTFGSIEAMYKTLKKGTLAFTKAGISPRMIEILKAGEEEAIFSKMLATIRRDAPINFSLPAKTWKDSVEKENVLALFDELEFKTLENRLLPLLNGEKEEVGASPMLPMSSPQDLKRALAGLWLLDSHKTDPEEKDLLRFTKAKSVADAQKIINAEIKKNKLTRVYEEIELPLIQIVDAMNARGVKLNTEFLSKLSKKYHATVDSLEKKIWLLAGEEFNIASPKQLGVILFEKLHLKALRQKKTSTGALSTRESELQKMVDLHPTIPLLLEYRELQKLLSTYIDNLPKKVGDDGRLRATFISAGTTTGRMASRDPNLQNIPIKSELGRDIRKAFIAEEGLTLAAFDYSQIELRIAAILSGDKKLISIFKEGGDVHAAVAAQIFKVTPDKVDKEMRRRAKVINFGILYGMGVNALRANLGTDRAEAQLFYNTYFETFKTLAAYLETIKADAKRKGYTETLFGRKRYFNALSGSLPFIQAAEERMAVNAPFQGTCADIMKIAMKRVDDYIQKSSLKNDVFLILQVHDELVYEIKSGVLKSTAHEIVHIMESVLTKEESKNIPLIVNASAGESWGDMKLL